MFIGNDKMFDCSLNSPKSMGALSRMYLSVFTKIVEMGFGPTGRLVTSK